MAISYMVYKSDLIRFHRGGVVFCVKCGKPIVIGEFVISSGFYVKHADC
jgi:hypothetical protein